ncbi:Hypothetical Protein FCC1311_038052 [Hondaea fermentalgiana]|uniref:Uncharacterized protein n=1 Tax=Hondaea fermentalgiana TaxID=2315210 RepID=A0A2R5G946_9STRA|nr:Hypothetical Protein FCC1311_038052 [Hondaea fermentalgiana]|eukprot:GBG27582.1 Hypothetical Protein FCC1311_038052 [Hondaea fermentalgiana]
MRNVAASVVLENAAHDEQCFARIAELQDHARTVAQNMSLAHGVFDDDNRGNETPLIYKLAALHGQLVNDAFYETLHDKAQLFRTGLDKVQSEASEAWDQCLAERLQLVSEHITFVRASYEDKLARARRHGADLAATERKRQTEERSQLQQRLEASHRRETSRLHHEHGLIRRELEQNLGAERRKTQALSNTMLTKNAKLKELEARCKELVQEITSLRDQLESQAGELEGKTANAQMFIAILQKQLRVALDSVEKLEADVEARDEQIKELDAQVGTLTSDRDGLAAKLESTEAVLQVFREDLAMCQQDLGLERDARCIAEQNADTLSHELAESHRNFAELKTAHIELTCDLRRSEASLEKERMLRHEEANQHLEQVGIWQQKMNVETGKVKELQFGMQEYAKLQQRYRELDVQRQEAEEQLRMERDAHAREREEAVRTAAAQLEQSANEETKTSHATPESLPSRQMTAAQFMSRLTQARIATNDSAEPEDGMENTPKDNEVVEDQVFFLETERPRGRMEQELRETLEREVREEIRRKCAETMQTDLEKRLRKEFEARNRIAVQRAVNAELARLAPLESKWAEVLRKHRQALDEDRSSH